MLLHTPSPTLPFPEVSLGREGGRGGGGGGGGGGLLAANGVAGRAGDDEPAYQGHFIKTKFSQGTRANIISWTFTNSYNSFLISHIQNAKAMSV